MGNLFDLLGTLKWWTLDSSGGNNKSPLNSKRKIKTKKDEKENENENENEFSSRIGKARTEDAE